MRRLPYEYDTFCHGQFTLPTYRRHPPLPLADLSPVVSHLRGDEVHIWLTMLDQPASDGLLAGILSPQERERAARFRFPRDRRRFIIARAALRCLIARYSGIAAHDITFGYGPYCKPFLAGVS